ncbi:MAG: class II aldolase/adducin family protein [Nitrososphaeraceae archaeon]|nr:class II aldolase/adducin family protein [Nitrososphaeraceae archaeon]
MNLKTELLNCVKALYTSGLNTAVSGNHSARFEKMWMWITPSEIPRYKIKTTDLVKINIRTKEIIGKRKPSREWVMHREIYENTNASAIVHCHSPYTLGISIASKFEEVIEEAKIIVGDPIIIENVPSGTVELASSVSRCFKDSRVRAVIIKNHGVVAIGKNLDEARSVVESLEEWAKVLTVCKIFNL